MLQAIEDPDGFVDAEALRLGALPPEELLARWRAGRQSLAQVLSDHPPGEKMPWFGPPMAAPSMASARYMETWAHGLDVAEALGVAVEPHDRVRHVVHIGVRTRAFAFVNRGLEVPAGAGARAADRAERRGSGSTATPPRSRPSPDRPGTSRCW